MQQLPVNFKIWLFNKAPETPLTGTEQEVWDNMATWLLPLYLNIPVEDHVMQLALEIAWKLEQLQPEEWLTFKTMMDTTPPDNNKIDHFIANAFPRNNTPKPHQLPDKSQQWLTGKTPGTTLNEEEEALLNMFSEWFYPEPYNRAIDERKFLYALDYTLRLQQRSQEAWRNFDQKLNEYFLKHSQQ